jgi:thiosulfate/3-mercaptopyruvate sulfurtransferase
MASYEETFVSSEWLKGRLGDPDIAVIDVRAGFRPQPPGPSDFFSMRSDYTESHIPGARYLHMVDDLSDPDGPFPFAALAATQVHQLLGSMGVSNDQTLVIYGGDVHPVTHRCWWTLRQAGATDVRLLEQTFGGWVQDGHPVTGEVLQDPPQTFVATEMVDWVANKETVADAIDDPAVGLVNALSAEQFEGLGQHYGRPGRIPSSVSVPAALITDPASGALRQPVELERVFRDAGAERFERLITYCGGGIAASTAFLALDVLGYDNISLYDGSLLEWNQDAGAPLEVGSL